MPLLQLLDRHCGRAVLGRPARDEEVVSDEERDTEGQSGIRIPPSCGRQCLREATTERAFTR